MGNLPQLRALLISFFCEALLYGVAFVLFVNSLQIWFTKRANQEVVNRTLVGASALLFLFATIHISGVFRRTLDAFTSYPEGPAAYFALLTTTIKTITQVGQVGAVITGDSLSVYRTYIVYNQSWMVAIIPLATLTATVITAVGFITAQHLSNSGSTIFSTSIIEWTVAFLATSLLTTSLCTAMIVYRLWSVQRAVQQAVSYSSTRRPTMTIVRILIESAALYSSTNLVYMVLYALELNAEAIVSGFEVPVASITFSLITLRVEAAVRQKAEHPTAIASVVVSGANGLRVQVTKHEEDQEESELGSIAWSSRDNALHLP